MAATKQQIIRDAHAIVSIVAGTAALTQEYQETVYTSCTCSNCSRTYWTLVRDKYEYLSFYPYCGHCGSKIQLKDVVEDHDVIGAQVFFLQKGEGAFASFKLTQKALQTPNIKQIIQKCNARYVA
jgi:DNA-directed RNA polymerase subunit RPC12/RpoP